MRHPEVDLVPKQMVTVAPAAVGRAMMKADSLLEVTERKRLRSSAVVRVVGEESTPKAADLRGMMPRCPA